jgi:hypothetical protein
MLERAAPAARTVRTHRLVDRLAGASWVARSALATEQRSRVRRLEIRRDKMMFDESEQTKHDPASA